MGLSLHSPVRPASPQVTTCFERPRRLDLEKIASTCSRVSETTGLSLFTKRPSASTAVRICVGLWPYLAWNASSSVDFIARDIGPNCAVPEVRAGGAVLEPFPSIWMLTFG